MDHRYYSNLNIILALSALMVFLFILCMFCMCRRPKTIVHAQKTFIIKKKIILEKPDPDKCDDSIMPSVKIDTQVIPVDIDSPHLNSCDPYELPLDPLWEVPRDRSALNSTINRSQFVLQ